MVAGLFVGALVAGVLLWSIFAYNRLVHYRVLAERSWHDIATQLKRRWDLIPNLVDTIKGYAAHEATLLQRVTQARVRALAASSPSAKAHAEQSLQNALFSLFAVAEAYPDLLADRNFLDLQKTLAESEDTIQRSRKLYNAVVRELNTEIASFPKNLIAAMFRFAARDYYALPDEIAREAPRLVL